MGILRGTGTCSAYIVGYPFPRTEGKTHFHCPFSLLSLRLLPIAQPSDKRGLEMEKSPVVPVTIIVVDFPSLDVSHQEAALIQVLINNPDSERS